MGETSRGRNIGERHRSTFSGYSSLATHLKRFIRHIANDVLAYLLIKRCYVPGACFNNVAARHEIYYRLHSRPRIIRTEQSFTLRGLFLFFRSARHTTQRFLTTCQPENSSGQINTLRAGETFNTGDASATLLRQDGARPDGLLAEDY